MREKENSYKVFVIFRIMPINAGPEYFEAEKRYLKAEGLENKIKCLEDLIRVAPKHKSSENLLAELKTRLRKFREKQEKGKKVGRGKKGIRKEGYQVVLVGKTNSGKSLLLNNLTNAHSRVSENNFTTKDPELGTMNYEGVKAQIVDLPSIRSKDFDHNIVNTADCLLLVIEELNDLNEVEKSLDKSRGKFIIVINKIDNLSDNERRKLEERCKSKRLNYILVSAEKGIGIDELKKKIFLFMEVIRVFTKEPGKKKNNDPVTLKKGATVKDVAETIYKGFSMKVKETRLTGPSGKFSNQRVGMKHKLKDMDIVEFRD